MASKNKFYVVWDGNETGVFSSWEECKKAVKGYSNAKYKGFPTKEAAQKAFSENYQSYIRKDSKIMQLPDNEMLNIGNPIIPSVSVDAACSGNPGLMEYRGVDTYSKKEIFRMPPMQEGTNNIGEFLAIVHALALMKQNQQTYPIYSDSKIAIGWVRKKHCSTKITPTDKNAKIFELIQRAEKWLHQNHFSNPILKWETKAWGEIPADFGRKG